MGCTGIYKIENKVNGKVYIGQSVNIFKRWAVHGNPNKATNKVQVVSKAIKKYGLVNFEFSILEICSRKNLNAREFYWINKFDSYRKGYNCTPGGDSSESRASKIKDEVAQIIRKQLAESQYSKSELAKKYGVTESTIRAINTGVSWYDENTDYPIRVGALKKPCKVSTCKVCGVVVSKGYCRCTSCATKKRRKVTRPSRIVLIGKLLCLPNTAIGKLYGVSDNAIKKWCKAYKIPSNRRQFLKLVWSAGGDSNSHMTSCPTVAR